MRTAIFPENSHASYETYGYSPAIKSGDFLFISGQVGVNRDGSAIEDVEMQFAQVFENLKQILNEAECSFDNIIDVTSFHVDMFEHFDTFAAAKQKVFTQSPPPSWTAIGVVTLADPALLLEVKAIAKLA